MTKWIDVIITMLCAAGLWVSLSTKLDTNTDASQKLAKNIDQKAQEQTGAIVSTVDSNQEALARGLRQNASTLEQIKSLAGQLKDLADQNKTLGEQVKDIGEQAKSLGEQNKALGEQNKKLLEEHTLEMQAIQAQSHRAVRSSSHAEQTATSARAISRAAQREVTEVKRPWYQKIFPKPSPSPTPRRRRH